MFASGEKIKDGYYNTGREKEGGGVIGGGDKMREEEKRHREVSGSNSNPLN